MPRWIFTFGYGHELLIGVDAQRYSLRDRYAVVSAPDAATARAVMHMMFGRRWAFQYASEEAAGVGFYGLERLIEVEWSGPTVREVAVEVVPTGNALRPAPRRPEAGGVDAHGSEARGASDGASAPRGDG